MQPAPLPSETLAAAEEAARRQAEQELARQQPNTLGDGIAGALDAGTNGAFDLVASVVSGAAEVVGNVVGGVIGAIFDA